MSQSPGIFERIVAGEIPCHRVYEDQHVLAFLDVGPVARGHCLLIPKVRYEQLDEMPPEVGAALGRVLPRIVAAVKKATGCDGLNVLQNNGREAGQAVMHVHFHLIPRYAHAKGQPIGFSVNWPAGELDRGDAEALREAIVSAMK